jgi:glucose/arabinose dehydrogenase
VFYLLSLLCLTYPCAGKAQDQTPSEKSVPSAIIPRCDPDNGGLKLPPGFCALVVADKLGNARHLAVNSNNDIYVAIGDPDMGYGGIAALRDTNGDGKAEEIEYFGSEGGTGIAIQNGYLYFAPNDAVLRYRLVSGKLLPKDEPETIVAELPAGDSHSAKSIALDGQGGLYVNIGAPSNACQKHDRKAGDAGLDPCPLLDRHGGIWRFDAKLPGQTQQKGGTRYASGTRNAVAIGWNTTGGELFILQHGRDQLRGLWPELYTEAQNAELPAEEMLLVKKDSVFAWPYCYYDHLQARHVLTPEYGGDGKKTGRCEQYPKPVAAFPGHYGPDDLLFYTGQQFPKRYRDGAFIAFHGSWNRAPLPQAGYQVSFVPFAGLQPTGNPELFAGGFAGVDTIHRPGEAQYRPVGLAQGPDGSLYIADSERGRIWRVIYSKKP